MSECTPANMTSISKEVKQCLMSKEKSVEEQLVVVTKIEEKFNSLESAVRIALDGSLGAVEAHFNEVKELLEIKQKQYNEKLYEMAAVKIDRLNEWRRNLSEATMKAKYVLLEARDLHSLTESDSSFLQQQYCSICKCLEESSMSLLLLRQSFPSCVCDYPMEVKDLMQKISSDLMQSILELNPTLSDEEISGETFVSSSTAKGHVNTDTETMPLQTEVVHDISESIFLSKNKYTIHDIGITEIEARLTGGQRHTNATCAVEINDAPYSALTIYETDIPETSNGEENECETERMSTTSPAPFVSNGNKKTINAHLTDSDSVAVSCEVTADTITTNASTIFGKESGTEIDVEIGSYTPREESVQISIDAVCATEISEGDDKFSTEISVSSTNQNKPITTATETMYLHTESSQDVLESPLLSEKECDIPSVDDIATKENSIQMEHQECANATDFVNAKAKTSKSSTACNVVDTETCLVRPKLVTSHSTALTSGAVMVRSIQVNSGVILPSENSRTNPALVMVDTESDQESHTSFSQQEPAQCEHSDEVLLENAVQCSSTTACTSVIDETKLNDPNIHYPNMSCKSIFSATCSPGVLESNQKINSQKTPDSFERMQEGMSQILECWKGPFSGISETLEKGSLTDLFKSMKQMHLCAATGNVLPTMQDEIPPVNLTEDNEDCVQFEIADFEGCQYSSISIQDAYSTVNCSTEYQSVSVAKQNLSDHEIVFAVPTYLPVVAPPSGEASFLAGLCHGDIKSDTPQTCEKIQEFMLEFAVHTPVPCDLPNVCAKSFDDEVSSAPSACFNPSLYPFMSLQRNPRDELHEKCSVVDSCKTMISTVVKKLTVVGEKTSEGTGSVPQNQSNLSCPTNEVRSKGSFVSCSTSPTSEPSISSVSSLQELHSAISDTNVREFQFVATQELLTCGSLTHIYKQGGVLVHGSKSGITNIDVSPREIQTSSTPESSRGTVPTLYSLCQHKLHFPSNTNHPVRVLEQVCPVVSYSSDTENMHPSDLAEVKSKHKKNLLVLDGSNLSEKLEGDVLLVSQNGLACHSLQHDSSLIQPIDLERAVSMLFKNQADRSTEVTLANHQCPKLNEKSIPENAVSTPNTQKINSNTMEEVYQIPHLETQPGSDITVLVVEVHEPDLLVAQPFAPDLIELMETMSQYYGDPRNDLAQKTLNNPKVGNYCSACFSEDNCWYRAKIMEVIELSEGLDSKDMQVIITYVDYGNCEDVATSNLRILHKSFRQLACQALYCQIKSISDPLYFSPELLGKTLHLNVLASPAPNSIDVHVISLLPGIVGMNSHFTPEIEDARIQQKLQLPTIFLQHDRSFLVVISHVHDISNFHVHVLDKGVAERMMELEANLQTHYSVESNRCHLFFEDDQLCCVFSVEHEMYCRAIAMKKSLDSKAHCQVQLIDYGDVVDVPLFETFYLPDTFLKYPMFAINCRLFAENNERFSERIFDQTTKMFKRMVCDETKILKATPLDDHHSESITLLKWNSVLGIDLHDVCNKSVHTEDTKEQIEHDCQKMTAWNPMQCDFLLKRNAYSVDDEDVRSAITGYGNKSVCCYFNTHKGCFAGDSCRFLHVQEGPCGSEVVKSHGRSLEVFDLPSIGDFVMLIVTAVATPQRFYAQLPLGPNTLSITEDSEYPVMDLDSLVREMSNHYNREILDEDNCVVCAGEVVAVRNKMDMLWFRAKILQCAEAEFVVFFVDYGNVADVSACDIRLIKQDFLMLPFQAIECYLTSNTQENTIQSLISTVTDTVVVAEVIQRNHGSIGVHLFDYFSDSGASQVPIKRFSRPSCRPG